ncbi:hypothetical protein EH223_13335 [candidate division KSB1 bacterium]|nr:SRPBCC family protein [candidate division KSB1 bacterium]RQW02031.1 MAG: hypothetical protein EH223_13335 [candidate division KSB1 bacterium]
MIKVTVSIDIHRPAADIFSYISNFANNSKWQSGVTDAYFTTDPPVRRGSGYNQVARFFGRKIESSFEVIGYEPGRLIKAAGKTKPLSLAITRMIEQVVEGSKVTTIVEGDMIGLLKFAEPLLQKRLQRSIEKEHKKLKKLLEKI